MLIHYTYYKVEFDTHLLLHIASNRSYKSGLDSHPYLRIPFGFHLLSSRRTLLSTFKYTAYQSLL